MYSCAPASLADNNGDRPLKRQPFLSEQQGRRARVRRCRYLLLGLADRIAASYDSAGRLTDPAVRSLGDALRRILTAAAASGVEHNELWSYRIERGRLLPTRYGTSSDVQLWSCTDLAVQFALSRLPRP
jgi:hypothetical protein